jgi:hypothetical protein
MKLTQYTSREAQIRTSDSGGIRQRWLWGLRLLADEEKIAPAGGLRHGVTDALIQAAAKRGYKLSDREIQRRVQCARTYKTEAQIRQALADFESWNELHLANFPAYEAPAGEPPADWRTEPEKSRDHLRAWLDAANGMDAMFPLSQFEPIETTLQDLEDFMKESLATHESIVAGFEHTHAKRREYLDRLEEAAHQDLTMTWQDAQDRLPDDEDAEASS